jgi:glucosylceramidase
MIKAAQKINPNFKIFSSPWSPPAWMKTNGKRTNGGSLKKEDRDIWARYVARYVTEFKKEGVNIFMVTAQNEPAAVSSWENCVYSAQEEAEYIVQNLKPALRAAGHNDVQVFVWDHNRQIIWERANGSYSVPGALEEIDGLAMHWYDGEHYDQV